MLAGVLPGGLVAAASCLHRAAGQSTLAFMPYGQKPLPWGCRINGELVMQTLTLLFSLPFWLTDLLSLLVITDPQDQR